MSRRKNARTRGAIRDKRSGVMLSRSSAHPLLELFTAVPVNSADYPDANLPPFNPPTEMKQLLAIHVFDNLYPGLPAPAEPGTTWYLVDENGEPVTDSRGVQHKIEASKYRLANPTGRDLPMGGAGEYWLPWTVPATAVKPRAAAVSHDGLPDVDQYTDAQIEALELQLDQLKQDRAMAKGLDGMKSVNPPAWSTFRERNKDRLRERTETEQRRHDEAEAAQQAVEDDGGDAV